MQTLISGDFNPFSLCLFFPLLFSSFSSASHPPSTSDRFCYTVQAGLPSETLLECGGLNENGAHRLRYLNT